MQTIDHKRRRLLKGLLGLPALGMGSLLTMPAAWAQGAEVDADYRALVCVFLHGGNDAFNMLVPETSSRWAAYQRLRGDLAIERSSLLPLSGTEHGFHPRLVQLKQLFDEGHLAIVANVGNLIEPLTPEQYRAWEAGDGSVQVPPVLFSHADQTHFLQTGYAPNVAQQNTGWGGRMIDFLQASNRNPDVPIGMSLQGYTLWLSSHQENQLALNSWNGMEGFFGLQDDEDWPPWASQRVAAWNAILAHHAQKRGPLQKQIVDHIQRAKHRATAVQAALALSWHCDADWSCNDGFATPYNSDNELAAQLRMVGRMIHAREQLGQKRQIFVVALGGWDTHGSQASEHPRLLGLLDEALHSFWMLLNELGVAEKVTVFTASEFGRTLGYNGDGTDHGWGGHSLILGGAVRGGVYGELPWLEPGTELDVGDVLLPTLATDQLGATLARWLGVQEADLDAVFPHLANFAQRDLGCLS